MGSRGLPAAAARLSAQTGALHGTLEIVWGDPQTGGEAITHYYLTTDDGRTIRLILPTTAANGLANPLALNGRRVVVESPGPIRNAADGGTATLPVGHIPPATGGPPPGGPPAGPPPP